MSAPERTVATADALIAAGKDKETRHIVVSGALSDVPSFSLSPEQSLRGADEHSGITFAAGHDGLQLSTDNRLHNIRLNASPEKRAIFNDTSVAGLGRIELHGVTTTGRVQILVRDRMRGGHLDVNGLDIIAADARGESERPQGYGVHVLQGAFTLWNMQPDEDVVVSADLAGLSAGRDGAPVRGSGIFVSGAGDKGGGCWCVVWRRMPSTATAASRPEPRIRSPAASLRFTALMSIWSEIVVRS